MKINYLLAFFCCFCLLIVYQSKLPFVHGNSFGAPLISGKGFTNSPFDDRTCNVSGCHVGTLNSGPGIVEITTDIPAEGYRAGETYQITATISQNGIQKFGFQMTAENGDMKKDGQFIAQSLTRVPSPFYITQATNAASSAGYETKSWSFSWIAPLAAGFGPVTFYGAFNAANSNGLPSGDDIYTTSITVDESVLSGEDERNSPARWLIYPNPMHEWVTISLQSDKPFERWQYEIFSPEGKLVRKKEVVAERGLFTENIHLKGLSPGFYLLRIQNAYGRYHQKMMIQ